MIITYLQTLFPLAFFAVILMNNPINGNHQGWLSQASCPCKPARTLAQTIRKLYRGLFVKPTEVYHLPVIKPVGGRSELQRNLTTYTVHTVTNQGKESPSCCNTEYAFEIFNYTNYNMRTLKVVHLPDAFQFVPTGICPPNTKCGQGNCIQQYRYQWLLVWDDTLQYYPPVTFVPVEIASHCECANVGS
ncbi:uncharacterized protein LOC133200829 [Saccostrea echinata]|uniref:uncharacterized protein LOC133200829 n=1 Tax=Saccostrea echinata TaxID=191078 RepID=UPI002A82C096|nr:uncharacterized protein LOC133200829 [Saccostrea echinata]